MHAMEMPTYRRDGAVPAIHIDNKSSGYPFSASARAINIPSTSHRYASEVPPPLPPPTHPITAPHQMEPTYADRGYFDRRPHASSVSSVASSAYGSMETSYSERAHYKLKDNMTSTHDEGYASMSSHRLPSLSSLPSLGEGFGRLHSKYNHQSTDDYSASIKDKLNSHIPARPSGTCSISRSYDAPPRPVPITSLPPITSSSYHAPGRQLGPMDSPPSETYHSSAVSPNSTTGPFAFGSHSDYDRSPPHRHRVSSRHGYDSPMEEHDMQRLNLQDRIGMKRRASSPLDADFPPPPAPAPAQFEMMRRREMPYRVSPTPRLSTIPQGALGHGASFQPIGPSYDRVSPNGYSTGTMSPLGEPMATSPYADAGSPMNTSPRGSISRGCPHQRNGSMASPRRVSELKGDSHKLHAMYICECCSKKPKKFETVEELRAHESEKQYECQYCGNRFKNKNEAERHQNSLHVRRHSWSCKALDNFNKAFHENQSSGGKLDTCGYCGLDFERRGSLRTDGLTRDPSDQDWDERVRHLQIAHKFRECNSSKKFFRADHFRQHLKHSHSGTSGKWTNQLENACMRDEELPQMPM